MKPPKKTGPRCPEVFFVCKFPEAKEERVNDDNIGVQTVDSGGKNEVEAKSMDPQIPCARKRIQEQPGEESQEMGTGNGTNFMPDDRSGALRPRNAWVSQCKVFDALGIEMDFAMLVVCEALEQFGEGALRAVPAINEG